jgi:signal transduction histidine kinase
MTATGGMARRPRRHELEDGRSTGPDRRPGDTAGTGPASAGVPASSLGDRPDRAATLVGRVRGLDRLDTAMGVAALVLVAALLVGLATSAQIRIVAPGLDVAFDTVTTLVTLAVAALAWQRYRDRGQRTALYETAAFLVLSASNLVLAAEALLGIDRVPAMGTAPLGQGSLYLTTAARLTAAVLLVIGEAPAIHGSGTRRPLIVAFGPAAALVAMALLGSAWVDALPPLVAIPDGPTAPALPATTPANVVLQVAGAVLFFAAAALARRRARRGGAVTDRYLAVGLVVAGFAQLHLAFTPSASAGMMTSGDLLFLAFDVILLLGIQAETRAYVVELRRANVGLERLRDAEVGRAAVEERARLSRELHDGLAQDLWFAKLKVGRLAALPDLGPEAHALCDELDEAIDAGLTEARQAVMALRTVDDPDADPRDLMRRYVDDYGDRFGIRTEFTCAADIPPLGTRAEAELLRIAQEALSNVRRHADATVVRVDLGATDGLVRLTVRDNGRGFDPAAIAGRGFGLTSMSERAALIGGRLSIESRPRDGTIVVVEVPSRRSASAGATGVPA